MLFDPCYVLIWNKNVFFLMSKGEVGNGRVTD